MSDDKTIDLRLGRWQDALAHVESVDALITDPPYSERTHGSHRTMPELGRSDIAYSSWAKSDVDEFVDSWSPRTRGWFVVLTDHILAPAFEAALHRHGRYVFSPLCCIDVGSRVRLSGDGPAQWSVLAVVARPANRAYQKWGALPGGYVVPSGLGRINESASGADTVTGGKPLWLMQSLVRDYTAPGDLVCDPCSGAGTTLLAARGAGRRAIGAEMNPDTASIAFRRIARPYSLGLFDERPASRKRHHPRLCQCDSCLKDRISANDQQMDLLGKTE